MLHWRLKAFRDQRGNEVDLVPTDVPADQPRPFSLIVNDATLTQRINGAFYRVSGDSNGHVDATSQPAQLVFEFEGAGGLRVRKEFGFAPSNYVVTFSASASDGHARCSQESRGGQDLETRARSPQAAAISPATTRSRRGDLPSRRKRGARPRGQARAIKASTSGQFRFAGVDDHYFIAAAIEPGQGRLEYRPLTLAGPGDTKRQLLSPTPFTRRSQPSAFGSSSDRSNSTPCSRWIRSSRAPSTSACSA